MFDIKLDWKSFKVSMPDLELWLRGNAGLSYVGNSAGTDLKLHFSSEPNDQIKALIQQMWDSMDQATEADKISLYEQVKRVVAYAEQNLPYIDITTMIPAEKKLWMGQQLNLQDQLSLVTKYPNV